MKLTMGQVLGAREGIATILKASMPGAMAFRLHRAHRALTEEVKTFDEARQTIYDAYAVDVSWEGPEDHKQQPRRQVPPTKRADFERDMNALLATEIEIAVEPVPFAELQEAVEDPGHVVSGTAWVQLEPILTGVK